MANKEAKALPNIYIYIFLAISSTGEMVLNSDDADWPPLNKPN